MITVFTPTYNREKELLDLYNSLLTQKDVDFEWLIVDDGSKDNTKKMIKKLQTDKKININYIYKDNGGKQSAYNCGLDHALGDVFICIDSDDILMDNVLYKIKSDFDKIKDDYKIGGIAYLQSYIGDKEKIIGTKFPQNNMIDTYFNIYHKYNVKGDKLIVLKTSVAKEYYFPLIKGEKFIPEALIFNRISLKYNLKFKNEIMASKEYLNTGYSNNYFSLVKRNPKGNTIYFRELYNFEKSFYNIYGYILFAIYSQYGFKKTLYGHPAKIKIFLMYIPVWLISKIK